MLATDSVYTRAFPCQVIERTSNTHQGEPTQLGESSKADRFEAIESYLQCLAGGAL
jgi:hypothetical protein